MDPDHKQDGVESPQDEGAKGDNSTQEKLRHFDLFKGNFPSLREAFERIGREYPEEDPCSTEFDPDFAWKEDYRVSSEVLSEILGCPATDAVMYIGIVTHRFALEADLRECFRALLTAAPEAVKTLSGRTSKAITEIEKWMSVVRKHPFTKLTLEREFVESEILSMLSRVSGENPEEVGGLMPGQMEIEEALRDTPDILTANPDNRYIHARALLADTARLHEAGGGALCAAYHRDFVDACLASVVLYGRFGIPDWSPEERGRHAGYWVTRYQGEEAREGLSELRAAYEKIGRWKALPMVDLRHDQLSIRAEALSSFIKSIEDICAAGAQEKHVIGLLGQSEPGQVRDLLEVLKVEPRYCELYKRMPAGKMDGRRFGNFILGPAQTMLPGRFEGSTPGTVAIKLGEGKFFDAAATLIQFAGQALEDPKLEELVLTLTTSPQNWLFVRDYFEFSSAGQKHKAALSLRLATGSYDNTGAKELRLKLRAVLDGPDLAAIASIQDLQAVSNALRRLKASPSQVKSESEPHASGGTDSEGWLPALRNDLRLGRRLGVTPASVEEAAKNLGSLHELRLRSIWLSVPEKLAAFCVDVCAYCENPAFQMVLEHDKLFGWYKSRLGNGVPSIGELISASGKIESLNLYSELAAILGPVNEMDSAPEGSTPEKPRPDLPSLKHINRIFIWGGRYGKKLSDLEAEGINGKAVFVKDVFARVSREDGMRPGDAALWNVVYNSHSGLGSMPGYDALRRYCRINGVEFHTLAIAGSTRLRRALDEATRS